MVTSAEGKALGAAVLGQSGAPELDGSTGQAMQSLSFFPMDDGAWIGVGAGDRVVVELAQEALEDQGAGTDQRGGTVVTGSGLWRMESPHRWRLTLHCATMRMWPSRRNGRARRVVLLPESASLYPGCARQGGQNAVKRYDFWKLSLLNIFAAPARSVLTVLGMAIGIGAILAVITLGDAGRAQVTKRDGASWHRPGMVDRFGGTDLAPWRRSTCCPRRWTLPQPSRYTRRLKHARAAVRKAAYWLGVPVSIWT